MQYLIDTHILIWWVSDLDQISKRIQSLMRSDENQVFVSAVTPWEIAMKVQASKLAFDKAFLDDFDASLHSLAFTPLPVTSAHAVAAARLKGRHKDPFDRLLVAQAMTEQLTVITADPHIAALGAHTVWE